ncbi:hypothetical protein [Agromyces larvae]|uniref:Uncharacterized protein n=1 Tax=Agromyces larvae TaxID=2929802 RepID=A0ABY4BVV2_9MICO|nr:hypothetical protein [Agromyces larvae]UOE43029.1 hypothetical protein MTO99_12620 [Agromyces larvae]
MRSSVPIPGNPWPHDMVIAVDDDPHQLVELLWMREAWGLEGILEPGALEPGILEPGALRPGPLEPGAPDAPPRLADPPERPAGADLPPAHVRERAADAWAGMWADALGHAGAIRDPGIFAALGDTADGSPERRSLLASLVGPSWRDELGEAVPDLGPAFQAWNHRAFERRVTRTVPAYDEAPEYRALVVLIQAWRAGLTKIVTIPCVGEFTRRIGEHVLLMTDATRQDPDRYFDALGRFDALAAS